MESLKILTKESINLLEKNNLLKNLVTQEYTSSIAEGINLEKDKLLELKKDFILKNDLEDNEKLDNWLKEMNISEKELLDRISYDDKITKFCREKFHHKVNAHFLKNKNNFDKVTYSLLRVKDLFTAQELYQRVKDSESSFGELSKNYSLGPEKYSLGVVGPIPLNQSHPNIVEMISGHKVGELLPPFKVESWWVILRIEILIEASLDEGTEDYIVKILFKDWLQNKADQKIKDLKNEIIQNS